MTPKKTDHAAEAAERLAGTREFVENIDGPSTYALQVTANGFAEAQVHAILAVAEQLRIANLIAVTTLSFGPGRADVTKPWEAAADTDEWRDVRDQIVKGLGL